MLSIPARGRFSFAVLAAGCALYALLLADPVFAAANPRNVAGCATFAPNGMFAGVTLHNTQLNLQFGGSAASADLPLQLKFPATVCEAFFSQDGAVLAIGLRNLDDPIQPLQIALADPAREQWATQSLRTIKLAPDSIGPLRGFLGNTHYLLTLSRGEYFADQGETTIFPVIFDPFGEKVETSALAFAGEYLSPANAALDLASSQLWIADNRYPCTLKAFRLGPAWETENARDVTAKVSCDHPDTMAFDGANSLLRLSRQVSDLIVQRVDVASGTESSLKIAGPRDSDGFTTEDSIAVSADRKFFGVRVHSYIKPPFGQEHIAEQLLVLQAEPLRVVAKISLKPGDGSFELANSAEGLKLALLQNGHWDIRTVSTAQ